MDHLAALGTASAMRATPAARPAAACLPASSAARPAASCLPADQARTVRLPGHICEQLARINRAASAMMEQVGR